MKAWFIGSIKIGLETSERGDCNCIPSKTSYPTLESCPGTSGKALITTSKLQRVFSWLVWLHLCAFHDYVHLSCIDLYVYHCISICYIYLLYDTLLNASFLWLYDPAVPAIDNLAYLNLFGIRTAARCRRSSASLLKLSIFSSRMMILHRFLFLWYWCWSGCIRRSLKAIKSNAICHDSLLSSKPASSRIQ